MSAPDVTVPFFKKKGKARPAAARKRTPSPPASVSAVPVPSSSRSEVVLPTRKAAASLLSAGSKRARNDDRAGAAGDGDADADDDGRGPDVKWTAAGSHQGAALDILAGDEAAALLAKRRRPNPDEDADAEGPDDGMYRGQSAYVSHLKKSKEVPKAMRAGPQRNASTIRTVTMVDYQPDVCKDYKETGFCGFGDTCKFLHDRGTYLQGWQLDKIAANPRADTADASSSSDDEDLPFACLICRKHYTDPVATRCGHYFCAACAIRRFARTPKCAACGAPTGGIFNRADKVVEKMRKKREEKEERGREEEQGGEGVKIEGLQVEGGKSGESEDEDEDD